MPLHVMSYDTYELGSRDAVSILFKDQTTGQKFVHTIDHPKYEVYVVKPEFRQGVTIMECWMEKSMLDSYIISYKHRDEELARILRCKPQDVKYSPWVYGYDISIEHFYWLQFLKEYHNDEMKPINVGFFDIESDIIRTDGKMQQPGVCPTTAITFVDASTRSVWTLVLIKDNLPVYAQVHPEYHTLQKVKDKFYEQVDALVGDIPGFLKEIHDLFTESYGELKFNLLVFEEEIRLHETFWQIVRASNIDVLEAWNAPYDIRNLIERPLVLGYDPESIICDPAYKYKVCFFEEDENVQAHKRNHKCVISVKFILACQMWAYAGLRVAEGKQSLKLNAVAKKELNDEKINYDEEGNIKTFMYRNLRKYWIYNIKDVLLQFGIESKTHDVDSIYDRCYDFGLLFGEAFVSTTLLTQAVTYYFEMDDDCVIGTNANRILAPFDYRKYMVSDSAEIRRIDELQQAAEMFDPDDIFDPEDTGFDDYDDDDFYESDDD